MPSQRVQLVTFGAPKPSTTPCSASTSSRGVPVVNSSCSPAVHAKREALLAMLQAIYHRYDHRDSNACCTK